MGPRHFATGLAAIVIGIAAGACGEDETDEESAAIADAVEQVATSGEASVCTELQTQAFTEQTVGEGLTGKKAVEMCERNAKFGVADEAEVSDVAVDGDSATAKVAITGSTFDGQTLELALVKDGDAWKLDELTGIDGLDREALIASYAEELTTAADLPTEFADCVTGSMEELSDAELEEYVTNPSPENIQKVFGACEKQLAGA